jgi:multimeric flavodoxin WrbA
MPKLLNLFHHAEALVLAAPVYFYGFPAQVKAVIDRCQPIWHTRSQIRKKRPAFFISTCASENPKEFQVIVREAKAFLNTLGFIYQDDLLVPGMDSPDSAARLVQACGEARRKGIDFVNRAFQI